jgi:WG containing repeat
MGYIDHSGNFVISPQYVSTQYFSDGLAAVCVIKKKGHDSVGTWGYVDKTGKMVIPAQFESAGWFKGCLADVETEDKNAYLNRSGKIVWSAPKSPKLKH